MKIFLSSALVGVALSAAIAPALKRPAAAEPTLDAIRTATVRFKDVKVALAEGYIADPMNMCEAAESMGKPAELGVMGIHYVRPDLLGITAPPNPVFKAAWEQAGNTEPPSYQGIPYDTMIDDPATAIDEAHNFAPHYDRHIWLYRDNPNGIFAQFNPNATCKHHKGNSHKH